MMSTTGRTRRQGFTLLELVLVMVVICTVLAMASASLRGFFASRRTADAATRLVALTRYARSTAAAQGQEVRLNVDVDRSTVWLTTRLTGPFVPLKNDLGRPWTMPEGTTVEWVEPIEMDNPGVVTFYPDGRCDVVHLRLTGRQGDVAEVMVDDPTGHFRVELHSADARQ